MQCISNKKKQKGFTLLEMIIVIVIVGILIVGSSSILEQGFASFFSSAKTIKSNWQNAVALETMTRDLRAIRSASDIIATTSTSITFNDVNANTISYAITDSQLIRTENNVANPLASDMQNLFFSYYDKIGGVTANNSSICYIVVDLGAQQPIATIFIWNLK